MTENERSKYVHDMFYKNPDLFPKDRRSAIVNGKVQNRMTPLEAHMAGGSFHYKVVADPKLWLPHSDPFRVMWAQSLTPDSSEISMTFCNATQFDSSEDIIFQVYFELGRAREIKKIGEKNEATSYAFCHMR